MALRPSIWLALRVLNPALAHGRKAPLDKRRADALKADALVAKLSQPSTKPVTTEDFMVPVDGGEILVRVYTPEGPGPFGAHLYLHGGAFWLGSVDSYDALGRWYAAEAGCVVASVDYRLAPDHKYPTQVHDAYAAWLWLHDHAESLNVHPLSMSVGGTSAGGSLAAALCLMARDLGGPTPIAQVLEIPATDFGLDHASVKRYGKGYGLSLPDLIEAREFYLADESQAEEPYASPLRAPDLSGLPRAFIFTVECDPIRDQGEAYGARLQEAGVTTVVQRCSGHIHASSYLTRVFPSARRYLASITAVLHNIHAAKATVPS